MSTKQLYTKNARVWIPHPELVWEGAVLRADYNSTDTTMHIVTASGIHKEIQIKTEDDLPPLRNPAILIGQNDLTALSYLHEPDVLHNLEVRFCGRQAIYTYCGIVLVAINPYAELPLYGQDIIRAYRGHSMGELEPHIFAVAEEAYAKLEREKCDLSIIVSGESGAGKTVSAKYAMRYFAAVGGSESETHIERKVLASSPIMESFGNAKTTRNDNSSRFGKFTKLLFTNELNVMSLTGATMQTYLLEKSRVVFQAHGERNYHIFYQLCAARNQWKELMLDSSENFRFLNQGSSPNIPKISDLEQFSETTSALYTLGFSHEEVKDILKILAAILHLGNIKFSNRVKKSKENFDHDGCDISLDDLHFNLFSEILKLNTEELYKWLTIRQIESYSEIVLIPIDPASAEAARDALAKHLYAKLFQYIVRGVNKHLTGGKKQNCFIGVLDIYGFETFETNSFEQFCINYANEKLQQQFNQHVFKLEQDEYLKEGIVWTMIDFYDNQPCIDLIESKLGILDLLDEECRMPKGSDESWVGKLVEKCKKYNHFDKSRFGTTSFLIRHFSDVVQYDAAGFLEKNRDTVSKELVNVLFESGMSICRKLMENDDNTNSPLLEAKSGERALISASKAMITPSKQHKQTVGSQFRESLKKLISTLHSTTPHYVRCIKPNEDKAPFKWEPAKIVQQLRACGVLETIRISAAGFPSRWQYDMFFARYRLLCKLNQVDDSDVKHSCLCILKNYINDEKKYRFGNSQIFFRAGQVAYLEQIRTEIRRKHIIVVQSMVRRFIYRNIHIKLKRSALLMQRYGRGFLAKKKASEIRRNRAAVKIQRFVRGWMKRRNYQQIRKTTIGIQRFSRGFLARQRYKVVLDNYKAIEIQRFCRGYLTRIAFVQKRQKIIICQAAIRRFLARRLYRKLRTEARTISHIQKLYKGLENKIISLQQKIDELNREKTILIQKNSEIPELRSKADSMRNLENELRTIRVQYREESERLVSMAKLLEQERDEKMTLLEEKDRQEIAHANQKQAWLLVNEELKKQVHSMIERAKKEDLRNVQQSMSEQETDEINQAYQRVVKDKEYLENENQILRDELSRVSMLVPSRKGHSRSASNVSNVSSLNNEDDIGYSSAKNTLEMKKNSQNSTLNTVMSVRPEFPSEEQFFNSHQLIAAPAQPSDIIKSSSTRSTDTVLILKLRKILDEEKERRQALEKKVHRLESKSISNMSNEDSLRASELEVENEKLRKDYQLLRNSIKRGVESLECEGELKESKMNRSLRRMKLNKCRDGSEAQYLALQEENKRRRDECIQLRAILAHQSQSLRSLGSANVQTTSERIHDEGELLEAFQAQKLVNRQLESELTALTEESNSKISEKSKYIDKLKDERNKLQEILMGKLQNCEDDDSIDTLKKNELYLRFELENSLNAYAELQEHNDNLSKKNEFLNKMNGILSTRLRDSGLDVTNIKGTVQNVADVKKKTQIYQGIFKYSDKDTIKILQKLIIDLTPRVAITLLPGLPAYIVFMCIRYTDLLNTDKEVRSLLTNFIQMLRKLNRSQSQTDNRVLWLVNSLKLHNLLKQYGGFEEYMRVNTEMQNQQQLKNFDLTEYRQVILEVIIAIYEQTVKQVQELLKQHIVPAILEHDEMARGKNQGPRNRSVSVSTIQLNVVNEPESLVKLIEHFYKQFKNFGLDDSYIEQIFMQLMYFMCAISMNNLMLRQELCMWKTGMKIRFNVSCLEDWVRQKKMPNEVMNPLKPLMEVSSLLQSRKSEEDVDSVYELCSNLTTAQVVKILKSYTLDDCEIPIKSCFIEKLAKKLNERNPRVAINDVFTMDENLIHPLKVVYKYDEIQLEKIELPQIFNLENHLIKI